MAGGKMADQVAVWDGAGWHALGRGTRPAMAGHPVRALGLDDAGILYVGESYAAAGDVDAEHGPAASEAAASKGKTAICAVGWAPMV